MASNNYTSANVVPSADTFREWVDLTNRITYDMEKVVVTVAANTQGARTSGNATVNGFFSANTVIVDQFLRGGKSTNSIYGTASVSANLVISTNTVAQSIIHAQANIMHSGTTLVTGANVIVNAAATSFTSNAVTNIFNTKIDANANVDIDNALTTIDSTNTLIGSGELNITSNVNIDAASIDINDGVLHAGATSINIDSTAVTFTSNAGTNIFNTPLDINANIDSDNTLNHFTSGNTAIDGGRLNIESNTYVGANTLTVNGTAFAISSNVTINASATAFSSNATLNIFNTPLDINANIDTDNTLTDFTSTTFNLSGTTARVDSTTMNIYGTDLDINSNTNIDGTLTTTNTVYLQGANATIGDANTDVFNVFSNSILNDKLNVKKAVDLDSTLNVDGATTLNGSVTLGDATADPITFTGRVASGINPDSSGDQSLGTATLRWDGMFDDIRADDVIVDANTTIADNLTVDKTFNVNTAIVYTQGSGVDTVTFGKGTTSNSRVNIRGRVNHNLIPFANTILLGNTTNRWVVSGVSGNFTTTLDVAGQTNLNATTQSSNTTTGSLIVDGGAGIAKNLNIGGTTTSSGLGTLNAGLVVSGSSANVTTFNASDISSLEEVTISSTLATTGAATFANTVGITGATTVGSTLGVTGATTLSDTLGVAGVTTLSSTLGVTGGATFASSVDIAGAVSVDGTTVLGDATGDTITLKGYVAGAANGTTLGIVPVNNGARLGIAANRWKGLFTTVGTSGDITAGADVDVLSQANTNTLRVRSTSAFEGNSTWSRSSTTGDLTITANTTQHNIGVGGIVCANLVVSGTATLPSDTSLTLATIGAKIVNVADTINLGTGANAVTQVIFGSSAGSGTTANVIFTNAEFSTTFKPRVSDSIDLGTAARKFRSGIFGTSVSVGTTVANTTAVVADNIYATNDIIGNYSSDHKLKDNVLVIDSALTKVNEIGGYSFTWNRKIGDHREGTNDYGVIAQEIENILPDAVSINSQGNKTVNYNALIPLLVEAVKELSAKVDYYMQADTEGDEE